MRDFAQPRRSAAIAANAMAATSHPLATLAAVDTLRAGGSAADAAVAAVAVLCVVEPHMTGIGGDCFALIAENGKPVWGYNGCGRSGANASTDALLADLDARGVRRVDLVLHVGAGTFKPVEVDDPSQHPMHEESFELPGASADALNEVRARGGKIWALGTTSARALESAVRADGSFAEARGETRLFVRPPYTFRSIDRLITNFHLPRSTLLMLVAALAGYDLTMRAYREAVDAGYRFYSYGDAMAII